jgi:hypothetical protein
VSENRVLRIIFGSKRDEMTGDWRKLHNEELHVARMGEKRNAYRIWAGKPEGKRSLGDQDVGGWTISKWILDR